MTLGRFPCAIRRDCGVGNLIGYAHYFELISTCETAGSQDRYGYRRISNNLYTLLNLYTPLFRQKMLSFHTLIHSYT